MVWVVWGDQGVGWCDDVYDYTILTTTYTIRYRHETTCKYIKMLMYCRMCVIVMETSNSEGVDLWRGRSCMAYQIFRHLISRLVVLVVQSHLGSQVANSTFPHIHQMPHLRLISGLKPFFQLWHLQRTP